MGKSNPSYNDFVSRVAREWCDIEGAIKPYLDGKDLLSWTSHCPNKKINAEGILRTIAGMQNGYIFSRPLPSGDENRQLRSVWFKRGSENFFEDVLNKTYECGSILKFSSVKKHVKYHVSSSNYSDKWTNPRPHPHYARGMELGRAEASTGEPNFLNYVNEIFKAEGS